jgi:hypothetical protein
MNQKDLASALERLLCERLGEAEVNDTGGPVGAVRKAIHQVRRGLERKPGVEAEIEQQKERIARMRALPADIQELLRRYFVFLEAEENICFFLGMRPEDFRRIRREARDYVLGRSEVKPDLNSIRMPSGGAH